MSELQVVNFSGFGNATSEASGTSYYEVHQTQWMLHPALALAVGSRTDIALGPVIQHSVTDGVRSPYLSATQPYGVGSFSQAGLQLDVRYDWRAGHHHHERAPNRVLAELVGLYFPAVMDVRSGFAEAAVTTGLAVTLPLPTHPSLVVRAGGKKLFGDFPFHEAAFIGGEGTTRFMDTQRYAGDASLYATSELRIPLVRFKLLMPLQAGIVGVAEAGRVYVDGSSPGGWHSTTGEGIWVGDGSLVGTIMHTTEPGHALRVGLGLHL
jgi:hypothetical protein